MLPRPSASGPSVSTSPASTVTPTSPSTSNYSIPTSLSTPDITNPSAFVPSPPAAPATRTRNVLRRKAATIGKHTEKDQSLKLSLVIPDLANPSDVTGLGMGTSSESQSDGPSTTSLCAFGAKEKKETDRQQKDGPAELASLRTTIDPQALPAPPTPLFPSASTPSTRYSESPGMWSRGSTPTTLSSYSPGIVQPVKIGRASQTRLPVFSPPYPYPSPQSAQSDRVDPAEPKAKSSTIPKKYVESTFGAKPNASKLPSSKSGHAIYGPPHSPPPRKSSINFSPSKNSDIDVENARKEVEEAERELFNSQRYTATTSTSDISAPKTPPRPSRHETQCLELDTFPQIQSNIPNLRSTSHTRREFVERVRSVEETHPAPNWPAAASVDSLRSKSVSQLPRRETGNKFMTQNPYKAQMKEPSNDKTDIKKTASPKRFGIFTRRSRAESETSTGESARSARKGPAAGTGHEGYGKYSQRGRKTSASSSSGTRTRSTSTTRSASQSFSSNKGNSLGRSDLELDEFLKSRLEPVIISGGGVDGAALSRTQSEQSVGSLSVASSNLPQQTSSTPSTIHSMESLAVLTGTSSETIPATEVCPKPGPRQCESPKRTSAVLDRSKLKSRMPIPKGKGHGIFSNSDDSKTGTLLLNRNSSIATGTGTSNVPHPGQDSTKKDGKEVKKSKPSRWNLFQWHRTEDSKNSVAPPPSTHTAQLHASITPVVNTRPVAHYEIIDTDSDELDDIMKNIENSPPTEEEEDKEEEGMVILPAEVPPGLNIRKRQPSILPSPPKMQAELEKDKSSPLKTPVSSPNMMDPKPDDSPEGRPRRLASVGRIPQVVSRRDRQHRPATQSFSRPFSVAESPSHTTIATADHGNPTSKDSPSKQPMENPFSQPPDWKLDFSRAFSAPEQVSALDFLAGPYSSNEFIHFSPHKGSPSSSISGALAAVTAVPPKPDTPPTEDEVWNEYDDLLDHVLSPEEPQSDQPARFGQDERFELATMASRALQDELNNSGQAQPVADTTRSSKDFTRLRRSRIVSALHSVPSTQPSYSDIIAAYGDSRSEIPTSPTIIAQSPSEQVQKCQSNFLLSLAAEPTAPRKSSDDRKATPVPSEREWDAVTRTNMRSASLMTSRWLSFGRVLFSPAHNHVKAGSHGRILVIDGLGNDDWSFYCSLTYSDAEVYSLSGRPASTALPHPAAWQPPTNHHTVYHAGLENPLPFPKDYFTVAVLRFPAASSEAVQSNIIQECKRVLRSGGYLEMSLLDRDMVNMGVRTRKCVRQLKEKTCLAHSSISLSPTSDSVQRLIGSQGFDNLRRCMVRIPVAGMVVRSSGSTTSSSNKSLSASATTPSAVFSLPRFSVTAATESRGTTTPSKTPPSDDNISLGDLLSDPSPSATNDESIAKIVARVGRWWYTKCYEDPVLPDTGRANPSIWNDRKVLRECQRRGTGFRMLIAYAQKPSEVKRRTASV
ncbi:hypothetical protein N7492_005661 [Penicillium capsulatum]|uniref:Methyltransferase type 11 domain-containing protein n=1 Tax=Penicillium capsulatum TaxID=69766 RepID=A0A9W9ICA2_9EURO|nr:hypothetical protein N7492_005661 [Penicillium capsulatum]KAJ6135242.1 hypothetical protein N7512_000402 [Penicillium capsulatum]